MKDSTTAKRTQCPSCGQKAKRVSSVTVVALLRDELASQITTDNQPCGDSATKGCSSLDSDTGWRFCKSSACDIVYFSENDDTKFDRSHLKVAVGLKETSGERPLCYCFGHSIASIKNEIAATGESNALQDIRAKMKSPGCDCEAQNPSGSCCLGSVAKGIQIATDELGMVRADSQSSPVVKLSADSGEKIAKIGTLVSAIVASSCCWLPLLLLAIGVSGAGIASTLESYRPAFTVVTFGFLAAAFYFTYRPRKSVASNDCCAPSKARLNMVTMNKMMLWAVAALAIGFLLFPSYVGVFLGSDGNAVTENMNQGEFKVDGMTCEGCSTIVAETIRSVPGVLAVEVSYDSSKAVVGTEICCPVPEAKILLAIEQAGYIGRRIDPSPPK